MWNYLGTYTFNAGHNMVVVSDNANEYVFADAIQFAAGTHSPATVWPVGDNQDAEYIGEWHLIGGPEPNQYGTDFYYHAEGAGANTCTWTFAVPAPGDYNVYAWWDEGANRCWDAPYTVNYEGGSATVRMNQMVAGGKWHYLGNYPFNAGNYTVVLSDDAGPSGSYYVIADAVKFELGAPPLIVDSEDTGFSTAGPNAWTCGTGGGQWRQSRCYRTAGTGLNTATWTVGIPSAGDYNVYAWWGQSSNRATEAPYAIDHDGGTTTIDVNQEENGSQWYLLGTYSFSVGNYTVVLSDDANEYVMADAIMWVPVAGDPANGSRICNHMPPDYSTSGMTFAAEFLDDDDISSIQLVGNSTASGWTYEDMTNTISSTWTKNLGANDWVQGDGYYFKVTDNSANVTFIGCAGTQYSVEGGYADNAAAEAAVQGDTYPYGGGPCSP